MYCPICKAEYRAGFDRCSDCLIGLVPTREQADAANVELLWEGSDNLLFNDIVGALRDANVPNYARSGAKTERTPTIWAYVPIVAFFVHLRQAREQNMWQVFVLESDFEKARDLVEDSV